MINEKTYIVYGKPACTFCTQAIDLLVARGLKYQYVNIMEDPASLEMIRARGFRTVPQIYEVDGEIEHHIGGFTELRAYLNNA
jgi:glutaredoxin